MRKGEIQTRRPSEKAKRSPIGAPPGTLIADPAARQSALKLTLMSPDAFEVIENASIGDVNRTCTEWPLIWLDCVGLANISLIEDIGHIFKLHPLALEDTVNTGQRPKIDFFENHAFIVLSMMDDTASRRYEQITVFFGENFVVTFQEREGDPFGPVRKLIAAPAPNRMRSRSGDYLGYALIDALVDSYFAPADAMDDKIDRIEDELLLGPKKHHVRQLHELRRGTNVMLRELSPLRDALAGLIRADVPFISPETKVYFNDTLDHSIRLIETVESQRDMLTGLIEMHLSLSQARINEIISFLTIVSAIFIPLTFLVGIWGMNFDPGASPFNMPELESYYGYPASIAFMLLVAASLIFFFRWKKWL